MECENQKPEGLETKAPVNLDFPAEAPKSKKKRKPHPRTSIPGKRIRNNQPDLIKR